MARKIECYLDTSALIAVLDRSDGYHSAFVRLFADPPRLVTSALVIAEGHGWFLRRYDTYRAVQFLAFLRALPQLEIRAFDEAAIEEADRFVKKFADQKLTLADAHGLAIMTATRIEACWSTDRHLGLTGARLVV